jgi:GTP-binding protein
MSAEHGLGFDVLYEVLAEHIPQNNPDDDMVDGDGDKLPLVEEGGEVSLPKLDWSKPLHVAIVGRPNAGKSTLVNELVGEERMMTGPEPGITRDAIHINWEHDGVQYRLVDTAGMRKKNKVHEKLERMSVQEALRAIRLAHVVILMTDADSPMDKQDLQIADLVIREGRSLVIAVNKWDTVDDKAEKLADVEYILSKSLNQVKDVPIVTISALKRQRLGKLMDAVKNIYTTWNVRVSTGKLNRWLDYATQRKPTPLVGGKSNRLRYITQIKTRPPTFALWAARPSDLPDSYKRYLTNSLRDDFDIPGTPIRLIVKTSKNPYVN